MEQLLHQIKILLPEEKKTLYRIYEKIIKEHAYLWEELGDLEKLRQILLVIIKLFIEEHKKLRDLSQLDQEEFAQSFRKLLSSKDALLQKGRQHQIDEIEAVGIEQWIEMFWAEIKKINKLIELHERDKNLKISRGHNRKMSQVAIRPIEQKDIGQVVDLIVERVEFESERLGWKPLTMEEKERENQRRLEQLTPINKYHVFYVAEVGTEIAGCGGLEYVKEEKFGPQHPEYKRLEGKRWFVHPKYTEEPLNRLGVGTKLGFVLLREARATGERYLYIEAAPFPRTNELYRKLGFEDYTAPWFDGKNPVMRKKLR